MKPKDYYKTLQILPNASAQEVKKAYRRLAHQYHPDKNQDNPFSAAHFREIQEAYSVLSDEKRRRVYDEERYFSGLSAQKEPTLLSGNWILSQVRQLHKHMATIDSYRMSHQSLHDYVLLLLSDSHIAVLQQENDVERNREIVRLVLEAIQKIEYRYMPPLTERLSYISSDSEELRQMILTTLAQKKKQTTLEKYLPLIVVGITLVLCLLMFLYSRR